MSIVVFVRLLIIIILAYAKLSRMEKRLENMPNGVHRWRNSSQMA